MNISEIFLNKVNKKCVFLLDNEPFSQELLSQAFIQFIAETSFKDDHNVAFVFHTGSPVFDAAAIIFAAISNLVLNTTDTDDIVLSLENGDFVIYGGKKKSRYVYCGLATRPDVPGVDYVLLKQGKDLTWVPQKLWRNIEPYNGESRFTSSIGIRKASGLREEFFKTVLDYQDGDIPSVIDTSTVLVMPRERADRIVRGLSIRFADKEIPLLDLVTASFFTESNELNYGGNIAKAEPILKITGKMSVASRLIRGRDGNKTIGMMVMGSDIISKSSTELPEYFDRKSLRYLFVCTQMDFADSINLVNAYEDGHLFACTKDFLLSHSSLPIAKNGITTELSGQVDAIIDHQIDPIIIKSGFTWSQFRDFKKALLIIRQSEMSESEKNEFIIQSCSLIKLFLTAVFSVGHLEKLISEGKIDIVSPSRRIESVRALSKGFPPYLYEKAAQIIGFLESCYLNTYDSSEKEITLRRLLEENRGKKIAIIVPKAYYSSVLHETGILVAERDRNHVAVSTANRFDNSAIYDLIISIGDYPGTKFDLFSTKSSKKVVSILYDFEANMFKYRLMKAEKSEKQLDHRSHFKYIIESEHEDILYDDNASETEIAEVEKTTEELDQFVEQVNALLWMQSASYSGSGTTAPSEVVAIVSFESGETALLTKMYKAYVFDDAAGEVTEVSAEDLAIGDSVVFKRVDEETKDIVDDILARLISDGRLDDDIKLAYLMSKKWKENLQGYMRATGNTPKEISQKMKQNGVSVADMTIWTWLDENAHTVGPREVDSIRQIALLVGDTDMFDNATTYHGACSTIRHVRRMILKEIGNAIISRLEGRRPKEGTIMADIFDRIESLAVILRIESIAHVKQLVPFNLTNRPIVVKE